MGFSHLALDFSEVPAKPFFFRPKRHKPLEDYSRVVHNGVTVGYGCSPECCLQTIYDLCMVNGDDIDSYLTVAIRTQQGGVKVDNKEVMCQRGCEEKYWTANGKREKR